MSTSAAPAPVPVPVPSEVPQRILFEPPKLETPYELGLADHGLVDKAIRVATNRVIKKIYNSSGDRFDASDTWAGPMFSTMLRSDPYHARELTRKQIDRYSVFREFSTSQFTCLGIEFVSEACCPDEVECDRSHIRKIRHIIDKHTDAPLFSKIGNKSQGLWPDSLSVRVKFMVSARLGDDTRAAIAAELAELDPETSLSAFSVTDKENFEDDLKSTLAPDLPVGGALRADFEFLLQGMDQIAYSGLSKDQTSRFALNSQDNTNQDHSPSQNLPSRLFRSPRSPSKREKSCSHTSHGAPKQANSHDLSPFQ